MKNPFRRKQKPITSVKPTRMDPAYYHKHPQEVPPVTHRRIKWISRRRQ